MSRHLMARFRHLRTADEQGLDFDWQPRDDSRHGSQALLENGDWLEVSRHVPARDPREIWEYTLMGPAVPHDELPGAARMSPSRGGAGTGHPILGQGAGVNGFDSHEEAQQAAETHYKALNRSGVTPSVTHGYDINDIMRRFNRGEL